MTDKITAQQTKQITRFMEDGFNAITINKDEAQYIIENGGNFQAELQKLIQVFAAKATNQNLKLLSEFQNIKIKASDGSRVISQAKDVFKGGIDSDFEKWGLTNLGKPTKEILVGLSEVVVALTFKQIFNNPEQQWLPQSQVINFCADPDNGRYIRNNGWLLFLIKKDEECPATDDNLFVVYVDVRSDGLFAYVYRLGGGHVWNAETRRQLVAPLTVPQLTT